MGLKDELSATPNGGQTKYSIPSGWQPSVTYAGDGCAEVVTVGIGSPNEQEWLDDVRALGVTIPDGWSVQLVQIRHDPAAWVRRAQGEDAVTDAVTRRVYKVVPARPAVKVDDLLAVLNGRKRAAPKTVAGDSTFVIAAADWQIAKMAYGEGTDETAQRILDALDASVKQLKELRRKQSIGTVLFAMLGDLCEGNSSQNGAVLLQSDIGVTEAIRVIRRLALEYVKTLAPLVDELLVTSVPGNHDQPHRFGGIAPQATDSWAVDVACQIGDALQMANGYDHVKIVVPDRDDLTVTVETSGTIIGMAHGHQIRKNAGHAWWSAQGHARHRIGAADILLTGHYHTFQAQEDGGRLWCQCPTVDPGSPWWDQRNGGRSSQGTLTLVTSARRWSDLTIL